MRATSSRSGSGCPRRSSWRMISGLVSFARISRQIAGSRRSARTLRPEHSRPVPSVEGDAADVVVVRYGRD